MRVVGCLLGFGAAAALLSACASGDYYDPMFGRSRDAGPFLGDVGGGARDPLAATAGLATGQTVTVTGCPAPGAADYFTLRAADGRLWTFDSPTSWPQAGQDGWGGVVQATGRVVGPGSAGSVATLGDVQWRYTEARCPPAA